MGRTWRDATRPSSRKWPPTSRNHVAYWCTCVEPKPHAITLFGVAMGGYQECLRCYRPIIEAKR